MRIAFVSDAIYPYNKGGKEKRLYELSTRLARLGHEVHIYTMHWWDSKEVARIEDGVHLHALCNYHPLYHNDRRSISEGLLFGAACLKLLITPFDILDVDHMPFFPVFSTWLVCILRGKRLYGTWHEALTLSEWVTYMGKAGYIAAFIEALSVRLPYHVTAASVHTSRLLAQYHRRSWNVDVVTCGVDPSLIRRTKPTEIACDVLYTGRLVKDKHVDTLIRAMVTVTRKTPDIRCVIIGHGVEHDRLQQLVTELHLSRNVRIVPPLQDAADVYAYMKRAKVFVLPSVREGFGIVALEALSCGTPVITTSSPANATKDLIIDGTTGSIVDLNERQLAGAITQWTTRNKAQLPVSKLRTTYDWEALALKQAAIYGAASAS